MMESKMMKDEVVIRDFRKSDLDGLLDLSPKCFAKEFEVFGFDPDHVRGMVNRGFGVTGRLFRGLLRSFGKEPIKFLVAEVDGRVVGTTIVNNNGRLGYISSVMVHPDHRNKGIATRMVKEAVDYVAGRRLARAVLHVDATNAPAISVYIRLGFEAFEQVAFFTAETDSISAPEATGAVEVRPFRGDDLNAVFNLVKLTEDPGHLRVYDFSRKDLKTSFMERLFRFSTRKKMVAVLDGKIAGYAETSYTTPKEAGKINSVQAAAQHNSGEVEEALINACVEEVRKGGATMIRVRVECNKHGLIETLKKLGFRDSLHLDGMVREI
jgi:ribosomal protein S18 acetylase RimI-like enzyme